MSKIILEKKKQNITRFNERLETEALNKHLIIEYFPSIVDSTNFFCWFDTMILCVNKCMASFSKPKNKSNESHRYRETDIFYSFCSCSHSATIPLFSRLENLAERLRWIQESGPIMTGIICEVEAKIFTIWISLFIQNANLCPLLTYKYTQKRRKKLSGSSFLCSQMLIFSRLHWF